MKWDITKAEVTVPAEDAEEDTAEDTVEAEGSAEGAVPIQAYQNL